MSKSIIVGREYRNIFTGNAYRCIDYDGTQLTLEGIGKVTVAFKIPWQMVLSKYQELKKG